MGKTINTILNLHDKFSGKLSQAGKNALLFKTRLQSCEGAAAKVDKFLNGMAKTAVVASAAAVGGMAALAKSSVETYGQFQQSMSNVAGILSIDSSSEAYGKLEAAAREAGKSTTKTAQESADALSYMALAGWSVEDSVKGLMPVLRASEATGADLATTSDLITDSMSALGLTTNELENYLDVCARAQNKSNTSLTQMQEAYIACGGTFKTFGTSLQESGALLGVLANRGIKGSEAGTKLQSTLVNLTKKSGESYKAMQALGVSAYDSQGNFKGVTEVLRELQDKTKNLTEEERNNYLTMIAGKTQLTTLNALMSGLSNTLEDGTNEFDALYATLGDCDGALDAMADTMTNNYAGAMARAGSAVDDFKITIGKKLEPYITKFLNWFAEKLPSVTEKMSIWFDTKLPVAIEVCSQAFQKIRPAAQFIIDHFQTIVGVASAVVTAMAAFSIMTKVAGVISTLSAASKGMTIVQTAMTVAQTALNTSFLACPLTWIAVGIGAIALVLYECWQHSETFRNGVMTMFAAVQPIVEGLKEGFMGMLNMILPPLQQLGQTAIPVIGSALGMAFEALSPVVGTFAELIGLGLQVTFTAIGAAISVVAQFLTKVFEVLGKVINKIKEFSEKAQPVFTTIGTVINTYLVEPIKKALNFVQSIIEKIPFIGSSVSNKTTDAVNAAQNAVGTNYFGGGLTSINEHGGELVNLPTGTQIIPADKTEMMIKENAKYRTPNINIFGVSQESKEPSVIKPIINASVKAEMPEIKPIINASVNADVPKITDIKPVIDFGEAKKYAETSTQNRYAAAAEHTSREQQKIAPPEVSNIIKIPKPTLVPSPDVKNDIQMPPVNVDVPYFGKTEKRIDNGNNIVFPKPQPKDSGRKFGDITVNVTVQGGIVGSDDIADEIGERVCEKIVEAVKAV